MNHFAGMDFLGIGIALIMSGCAVYSIVGPVHSYALRRKARREQRQPTRLKPLLPNPLPA